MQLNSITTSVANHVRTYSATALTACLFPIKDNYFLHTKQQILQHCNQLTGTISHEHTKERCKNAAILQISILHAVRDFAIRSWCLFLTLVFATSQFDVSLSSSHFLIHSFSHLHCTGSCHISPHAKLQPQHAPVHCGQLTILHYTDYYITNNKPYVYKSKFKVKTLIKYQ